MKLFTSLILLLMVGFLTPVWATSGKDSGGISQQNINAVKPEIVDSNPGDIKQAPQVKDEATHDQNNADKSSKK